MPDKERCCTFHAEFADAESLKASFAENESLRSNFGEVTIRQAGDYNALRFLITPNTLTPSIIRQAIQGL